MAKHFSAVVIGTGQAGPSLAAKFANAGMSVAVIERKFFGGTCVNTGCIPTKTLVASAYAIHMARRGGDFGFAVNGPVTVDMKRVKARKDRVFLKSRNGVESWLKGLQNCTVYEGHARFSGSHEISVGDDQITADKIFINVGGRALIPQIPGLCEVPYLDNSSMMDVEYLPKHLMILGGSYIGLEFGQMYRRFGSEVTIIENGPRIISREDEDTSNEIQQILESEGVRFLLNSKCTNITKAGDGVSLTLESNGTLSLLTGSHLLVATGRRPNTDDLGLEAAGIGTDRHGYIQVDDELQTNIPGVWALGDCNGRGAFTHTSYNDYEIVAANLFIDGTGERRRVSDRITNYALYTDPPLGRVGLTKAQARASGRNVLIGRRPMTRVGRAVEKGEDRGFMEILVDADTRRILGGTILGPGGDEAIHCIIDLMYAHAPCTTLQRAMHIHPTVSELLPTIAGELQPL